MKSSRETRRRYPPQSTWSFDMATVPDTSGNSPIGGDVDRAQSKVNRILGASPEGTTTPAFVGEIVNDSTNEYSYIATSTTSADWQRIHPDGRAV